MPPPHCTPRWRCLLRPLAYELKRSGRGGCVWFPGTRLPNVSNTTVRPPVTYFHWESFPQTYLFYPHRISPVDASNPLPSPLNSESVLGLPSIRTPSSLSFLTYTWVIRRPQAARKQDVCGSGIVSMAHPGSWHKRLAISRISTRVTRKSSRAKG